MKKIVKVTSTILILQSVWPGFVEKSLKADIENTSKQKMNLYPKPTSKTDTFDIESNFTPSGWMGDGEDGSNYVSFDPSCKDNPRSGTTCIKISYTQGPKKWAGIYWLNKTNNWGHEKGIDLTEYNITKITFWARSDNSGQTSQFKAGGVNSGQTYSDSFDISKKLKVVFGTEWKKYEISLKGKDLSCVIGGFCWVANDDVTLYLDDIQFE